MAGNGPNWALLAVGTRAAVLILSPAYYLGSQPLGQTMVYTPTGSPASFASC